MPRQRPRSPWCMRTNPAWNPTRFAGRVGLTAATPYRHAGDRGHHPAHGGVRSDLVRSRSSPHAAGAIRNGSNRTPFATWTLKSAWMPPAETPLHHRNRRNDPELTSDSAAGRARRLSPIIGYQRDKGVPAPAGFPRPCLGSEQAMSTPRLKQASFSSASGSGTRRTPRFAPLHPVSATAKSSTSAA